MQRFSEMFWTINFSQSWLTRRNPKIWQFLLCPVTFLYGWCFIVPIPLFNVTLRQIFCLVFIFLYLIKQPHGKENMIFMFFIIAPMSSLYIYCFNSFSFFWDYVSLYYILLGYKLCICCRLIITHTNSINSWSFH